MKKDSIDEIYVEEIEALQLTDEQVNEIKKLILLYVPKKEVHRYNFEDDMALIDYRLKNHTQSTELILIELAMKENNVQIKSLFKRLYGDMGKYENIFPEVI